ncbi:heme-binding beta-barrel domain-containing protein [Corynebacterium suedekumii]|nr:heme-binding beta-barrel domain-containing protein [Corynebacterium suedekumii]
MKRRGDYPTIDAFTYTETITFTAIPGKPFFRYEQKTVSPEAHTDAYRGRLPP